MACGCSCRCGSDPADSGRMDAALPHVAPGNAITDARFTAFYHMAAAIACRSRSTDPTIMAARLDLLRESYERDIIAGVLRLSPTWSGPDVPAGTVESTDLSKLQGDGDARPIHIDVEEI